MRASPLNDVWLPRSTPYLLKGKRFYHLRSGNSATCSTRDEPLDAYLVNNIDQAGFVAVDDDVPPTDAAYQDVLRKARERNIPILKTSDLKLARQLFHGSTKTKLNDLFGHPRSSESAKQFTVQEGRDTDGCPTLTFGENDIECRNSDEGNELLDHEILLRDPIVRRFAQTLDDDWKHFREIIRTNPLRIVNTRWKIKDVLGDYRSNAWDFVGPTTCVREWDEAKFNEDFKTPSDHVKPTKAVRAALFVFYITNEKSVKDRLPPASASPSIESATETDEEIPGDNNETMTPSPADLDNIKLIQKIILDEETNKKAIEVQQLQIEQMADCGHWLIHQHIQRGQLVTDLLQTVVAPRRAKAASNQGNSPETDQVWFNARLSEGAIKTIPYQDIEFDAANLIGRGDSGSVYRVTWNDRDVALKVFYERSLFLREMRSIYSVGPSDNIIQLEGTTCNPLTKEFEMVMEYASNGSLHDYWKNRPNLRWPFKVDMALQLAHALQCIHSNGFVHDNLDCSNILVRQNGSIALSGFSMSSKSTSDRFDDQQPNTELSRDLWGSALGDLRVKTSIRQCR
ncbi:hypothetical protein BC936DRAFT_145919 [Jimgerdemannia flammicorona]|uniref:Protein kinase domain-containing protein n=1 Tax=Jimgerdemannia flammicorona TaxID=994334 RepID=A0A433D8S9_9FUNG|nr:hypothetical protein BC936DRAFT_145919 [Jimgerdemannia flammicorona]